MTDFALFLLLLLHQWIRITSDMLTMSSYQSAALLYIISFTHPLQGVGNALGECYLVRLIKTGKDPRTNGSI